MSIAFKRIIKFTLLGLLIAVNVLGVKIFTKVQNEGTYTVETTDEFISVIEWGEEISIDGIKIKDNRFLGIIETDITEDMIISVDDTDVAGRKQMVIEHNGKQLVVYFDVKYRVEFLSYGEIIDTQLVVDPSELNLPEPTPKTGYEFSHWDYNLSEGLNSSVQINAVFKEIDYPVIADLTATYGDTLADLELPSNERGYWEFTSSLDTPVGNAGVQSFGVRFVFYSDPDTFKYDFVDVTVNKQVIEFTDIVDSFVYDGEAHFPAYSLPVEVEVISTGVDGVVPGTYEYTLEVVDINYCGEYAGSYEITKPTVTVTVPTLTIVYPEAIPEIECIVEGFENVDILGIKVDTSSINYSAGVYELDITYTNDNVNYVVNKGELTVLKGDQEVAAPTIGAVTFEDKLSDVQFVGTYLGTWSWETPDTVIDSMDGIVAYAIFTHDDPNLNPVRMAIEITGVQKKQLTVTVLKNVFTYSDGAYYSIVYEISGSIYDDIYSSLTVNGNVTENAAGSYRTTLAIDDARYIGVVSTELVINKATPVINFGDEIVTTWTEGLHLNDIELPAGYSWVAPSFIPKADEYVFDAIYTPTDTDNYEVVSGQITVKINKAPVSVGGIRDDYSKTYDTGKIDVKNSGIQAFYTDGTLTIKYYKNGVEVEEMINVGDYTVVITVSEGTNYLGIEIEKSVTISPATNTQSVVDNQSAKCLDPLSVLVLPEDMEGSWSWLETEIGVAGIRTFTAVYTPDENGNYDPREVEITVTVSKITIDVPSISDKLYTGDEIDTGLTDTDRYTVSGDITATNAGTYYVTFTLTDSDNYEWKGASESASVTRSYKISNALNSWKTEPQNITAVYTGNPVYMSAEAEHGTVTIVYTLNGVVVDAPIGVGVYKVTVTATADNYDDFVAERTIEITPAIVPLPSVGTSFPYNGGEQGITITDANLDVLYVVDSETRGTNAESVLSITLKLKDSKNYKWATTDAATVTFTAKITKLTVSFTGATTVDKSSWTYTEAEGTATVAPVDADSLALGATAQLLYSYNGGAFVAYDQLSKTNGKLNAGTYAVKSVVPATVNWDAVETATVTFTVNKATPNSITVDWGNSPKTDGLYYQNLLTLSNVQFQYNTVNVPSTYTYGISTEGFKGADTVYVFSVVPKDSVNFAETSFEIDVPLKTVATMGHNGTGYGTIEAALNAANSGQVVWVVADSTGNVKILENVTVKSDVTLRLPHGSGSGDYNSNNKSTLNYDNHGLDAPAETNPSAYRMTYVILSNGVTLTVASGGKVDISGELSGGGYSTTYQEYAGHTARYYALLELESNAVIDIYGSVNTPGYIRESTENNGSQIYVYNGGTLDQPMVLRDYRTGNYLNAATSNPEYSPFSRFIFMNVSPKLTIYAGGMSSSYANLYAGKLQNNAKGKIVGDDSSSFIQLNTGRLEFKYDIDSQIMDVHFYGGAKLNAFKLNAGLFGDITSSDYPLPISYHINVTLDKDENQTGDAVYTMGTAGEQYKMLPGAVLIIESGAVLNVSTLNVYDGSFVEEIYKVNPNNHNELYNAIKAYPQDKGDAMLIVRGSLIAENLAGNVRTDTAGATVVATKSIRVSNREITRFCENSFSSMATADRVVTNTLNLYNSGNLAIKHAFVNVVYTSNASGGWDYIEPETVEITLQNGYGIYTEDAIFVDENGDMYIGTYDSRTTKQNGTLKVILGGQITFYLTKNQIFSESEKSTVTFTSLDDIHSSDYEYIWTVKDATPVVYNVCSVYVTGTGISKINSVSISYNTSTGAATVELKSASGGILSPGSSFSVNGTAASSSGSFLSGKSYTYKTTVSTDTVFDVT